MIKAIVFDFDGLILETERPQYEAWRDVYTSFGRELPEQAWLEVMEYSGGTGWNRSW